MTLQPHKYNPGFHEDDELVRSFVVRHRELELLLETVRENTDRPANQHVLVVGPRGIGKTMLVRRLAIAVRSDPALDTHWFPLLFPEEAYEVLTPGEFWLEALFHLGEQTKEPRWQRAYEELRDDRDENRLRDRALAQLFDFADAQHKRILLIAENLNMLLGEQIKDQGDWDLRHTLQNEPRLMLLATATARFEEIEHIDRAWFELFAIHQLHPLAIENCQTLWQIISGTETPVAHLRPIQILTGGNPRLLRILAEFAARRSFQELLENLIQLIDDHTDYFKSQLDNLAPAERKVFVVLLDLWDQSSAQEVARAARMSVSQTSALLHRLVARGAVEVVNAPGRRKWYQAVERLYNIYYLMRRRSHPSNRVRAVVSFMVQFYQGEELEDSGGGGDCRGTMDALPGSGYKIPHPMQERKDSLSRDIATEKEVANWIADLLATAATGHAREALKLLVESPARAQLEPLEIGLRLFLGEEPRTAQEILEVGRDVAQRIRDQRNKRDSGSPA